MKIVIILFLSLIMPCAFSQKAVPRHSISKDSGEIVYYGFNDCSIKPQYPGGDEKLLEFISKNLHYPNDAIKNNIEGRVVVKFIIKEDGVLK